ncbi:MAG: RidA family protein [Betaproteobacteria bacterium]|nr:RidA family protein [Betaproteobacteria bacterium]
MIKVLIPKTIPAPSGSYVHGMEVPANARLLFIAGQTPGRMDGSIPTTFEEQIEVVWQRIGAILAEAGMSYADLVKVQTFVTKPEYLAKTSAVRKRVLGEHRPTATLLCITSLATPEYMVEIEAIAAKV